MALESIEYQTYAVAYIDILGFSNYIESSEMPEEVDKRAALYKLFHEVIPGSTGTEEFHQKADIECISVSDSFIISAPAQTGSSIWAVRFVSIKAIQIAHALLGMGLLVRGAITVGNAYRFPSNITDAKGNIYTTRNIIGTAYQKAVNAEKDVSYPRIVICDCAKDVLLNEQSNDAIYTRQGDVLFLNSLHADKSYVKYPLKKQFDDYKRIIIKNLKNSKLKDKEKDKWRWFANLYNATIKSDYFMVNDHQPIAIDSDLLEIQLNTFNTSKCEEGCFLEPFNKPSLRAIFNQNPSSSTSQQS